MLEIVVVAYLPSDTTTTVDAVVVPEIFVKIISLFEPADGSEKVSPAESVVVEITDFVAST